MDHTIRRMNYSWTQLISSYHSFCMLGGGVSDGEFRSRSPALWYFEPYWSFNQFEREAKWNKNWKQVLRFFWLACKTWNKCYVTCICHSCWPAPALTLPLSLPHLLYTPEQPHLPCAPNQPHLCCFANGLHRLLVCNHRSYLSYTA